MNRGISFKFNILFIFQIVLAAFLIVLGIKGMNDYNSDLNEFTRSVSRLFGEKNNPLNMVIAVVQLISGIALAAILFLPVRRQIAGFTGVAVCFLWLVFMVFKHIVKGVTTKNDSMNFSPDFLTWLLLVLRDGIILLGLWMVSRKSK